MNRTAIALSAVGLMMLLAGAVGTVSAATPGFAVYKVQFSSQSISYSLTVNETVATTSSPSYDNLILSVVTGTWNSSYSRSVNSSAEVSPFLPSITNQTFSYASGSGNLSVSISKNGTTPLQFQGTGYTLTSYSLSARTLSNDSRTAVQGAVTAFPSGLVDSVKLDVSYPSLQLPGIQGMLAGLNSSSTSLPISAGGWGTLAPSQGAQRTASVSITLLSTSLPLNAASSSVTTQAASIGIGAGAAVSALAIGLGVRYHGKHKEVVPEKKPEHWVD
jgi:hypothetical protein